MITVVGSINLDLIAAVERLPAPGETLRSDGFSTAPGGKGANQALAAARAGGEVRMIGAVGRDGFAAEALACLKEGKVQLSGVREAAAATGIALIFVDGRGENVIVIAPGANDTVLSGDLARANFRKGEIVLLVGPPVAVPASAADADALLRAEMASAKPSQAAAKVAKLTGLDRKTLYARALELK